MAEATAAAGDGAQRVCPKSTHIANEQIDAVIGRVSECICAVPSRRIPLRLPGVQLQRKRIVYPGRSEVVSLLADDVG